MHYCILMCSRTISRFETTALGQWWKGDLQWNWDAVILLSFTCETEKATFSKLSSAGLHWKLRFKNLAQLDENLDVPEYRQKMRMNALDVEFQCIQIFIKLSQDFEKHWSEIVSAPPLRSGGGRTWYKLAQKLNVETVWNVLTVCSQKVQNIPNSHLSHKNIKYLKN